MNQHTLQDLRRTLAGHAADASGGATEHERVLARAAGVRSRVRTVRRRRTAAGALLAVAVLAGAGALAVLPGTETPQPADRELVGRTAPETLTSLEWTYAFAEGAEGEGRAGLELPPSDEPRLLTWATPEAGDGGVRVRLPGEGPRESGRTDFTDFALLAPGFAGPVSARADGEVAVAVYELTDEAPAGHTEHGVTFRERVADRTLVAADVAEPGAATLEVVVPSWQGRIGLAALCVGGAGDAAYHVDIAGESAVLGSSCDDGLFDPAAGSYAMPAPAASGEVLVRVRVTDGLRGPLLRDPDLLVGLGVYRIDPPAEQLAGQGIPAVVEREGHRWRLVDITQGAAGAGRLRVPPLAAEQTLVQVAFRGVGQGSVNTRVDGGPRDGSYAVGAGVADVGILSRASRWAEAWVRGPATARAELGLARYERVD